MTRYWLAARRLSVVACIALGGCVSHAVAQRGDAAAARGDWREAEAVYREAVEQEPDNVDLARKYGEAKAKAVATALRTAEACRVSHDARCIERELGYVLRLDPSHVQAAQLRTQVRAELALEALGEDVTALVKVGDEALTREDYVAAERAFDTAFRASGDPRFQGRASFASAMVAAKRAIDQRAFDVASGHLRTALATQEDRGRARALLEDVEPRVYRIRLESVAITQTRPGTSQPWVGKPWWRQAAPAASAVVAGYYAGSAAGKVAHDLAAAMIDVPPENRPGLVTTIELPDGRLLKTQKLKGIYVIYGAEFFLYTNKLDHRTVRVSVVHERSGGDESVAVANVQIGHIVSGHIDADSVRGDAQALQQIVFSADPAEAWQDGMIGKAELQDQRRTVHRLGRPRRVRLRGSAC